MSPNVYICSACQLRWGHVAVVKNGAVLVWLWSGTRRGRGEAGKGWSLECVSLSMLSNFIVEQSVWQKGWEVVLARIYISLKREGWDGRKGGYYTCDYCYSRYLVKARCLFRDMHLYVHPATRHPYLTLQLANINDVCLLLWRRLGVSNIK
jgi:DNA-directed RNA polymerase subunit RPC12/RpoP